MKLNNVSFPYPVLGIGDDVMPSPSMQYSQRSDKFYYYIDIDIDMQNEGIQELIESGKVVYVCEVECPTTYLRKGILSATPHIEIKIPRKEVARTVTFQCTATVIEDIDDYENEGFHEDYKGFTFRLTPGDLIAYFGDFTFEADIQYDKLKSVDSMMSISERSDITEPQFNLAKDKIDIQLPNAIYKQYKEFGKKMEYASIIHSSLVLNALTYALYNIDEEVYQDKLWVRTIKWRLDNEMELKSLGIDPFESNEGIPQLAQAMLGNPYKRMFEGLDKINNLIISSEED